MTHIWVIGKALRFLQEGWMLGLFIKMAAPRQEKHENPQQLQTHNHIKHLGFCFNAHLKCNLCDLLNQNLIRAI